MESGAVHNDHDYLSDHDRREHHIDQHPATDDNFKTLDLKLDAEYLRTAFNLDGTPYFDLERDDDAAHDLRLADDDDGASDNRVADDDDRPEFVFFDDGRYWNDGPGRGESDPGGDAAERG